MSPSDAPVNGTVVNRTPTLDVAVVIRPGTVYKDGSGGLCT